jgi:hypothetical protein
MPWETSFRDDGFRLLVAVPLACGGADVVENMQWQTVGEAKAKDRWERGGGGFRSNGAPSLSWTVKVQVVLQSEDIFRRRR